MSEGLRPQRRNRRVAMTPAELEQFLTDQRTCRVATVGPNGPHATPLWFVWHDARLWLYSLVRSRRWTDLTRDPRIGVVVDEGDEYADLRGVTISGHAQVVGEVPRAGRPEPALTEVERAFAQKYFALDALGYDERHAWLMVTPSKITSWDFRKLAGA